MDRESVSSPVGPLCTDQFVRPPLALRRVEARSTFETKSPLTGRMIAVVRCPRPGFAFRSRALGALQLPPPMPPFPEWWTLCCLRRWPVGTSVAGGRRGNRCKGRRQRSERVAPARRPRTRTVASLASDGRTWKASPREWCRGRRAGGALPASDRTEDKSPQHQGRAFAEVRYRSRLIDRSSSSWPPRSAPRTAGARTCAACSCRAPPAAASPGRRAGASSRPDRRPVGRPRR